MTFEKMKKRIDFREYLVDEIINPIKDSCKFSGFDGLQYLSLNDLTMADARVISDKYLGEVLGWLGVGTSIGKIVRELNYNACMHGNKWNKNLDVHLKLCYGNNGLAAQIIDSGDGFDYVKYCNDYKIGVVDKGNKGAGFLNFNCDAGVISFEGNGNIANYMYLVSVDDMDIWQEKIWVNNKNHFSFD